MDIYAARENPIEGINSKKLINKISKTSNKLYGFLISNFLIFILISTTMHWSIFFLLWWLPSFTYYSLIIRIRNISEHAVTPGNNHFDNTRTTKSTFLTRFLMVPHNVNYHLEHHLFTRCPWYNLPKAHQMLIENGHLEKMCIETAIGMTSNNRVAAAEMLGLSRQSLYVKLRKYNLV